MKYIYKNIKDYCDKEYLHFYNQINKSKQTKINTLCDDNEKRRSILGEILLINLLKEQNIDYKEIKFEKNKDGKPFIKNFNIFYSISHSNDYVICGISNKEIGIDIEKIHPLNNKMLNSFCNKEEKEYILADDKDKRFIEIFSLKEAYGKCYGFGINHIKEVHFKIINNKIVSTDNKVSLTLKCDIPYYIISIVEKTC